MAKEHGASKPMKKITKDFFPDTARWERALLLLAVVYLSVLTRYRSDNQLPEVDS